MVLFYKIYTYFQNTVKKHQITEENFIILPERKIFWLYIFGSRGANFPFLWDFFTVYFLNTVKLQKILQI